MYRRLIALLIFLTATIPSFSQVSAPGESHRLPISVGAGFSEFATNWSGYENGPAVWLDWNFYNAPSILNGIGIEVQGRDLNYNRTGDTPNLREDTIGGGVIYTFRKIPLRNFHYYGKFLMEYGSIDFHGSPGYNHDTRTVYAPGTGVEARAWHDLWIRGEYEWQFWPDFPNHHAFNPTGFTVGATYRLPRIKSR
ncbi:MAG TPA: outer membrane beta-barrel protein [Terracidiphilus sp.]|jgi:opacity protein-like surface antigen